jgi:hypothetical protein
LKPFKIQNLVPSGLPSQKVSKSFWILKLSQKGELFTFIPSTFSKSFISFEAAQLWFSNFKVDVFLCALKILEKNQNLAGPACHPPSAVRLASMLLPPRLLQAAMAAVAIATRGQPGLSANGDH